MKKTQLLFIAFSTLLVVLLSSFALNQNNNTSASEVEYAIMRTLEATGSWPAQIVIAYPDGTNEIVPLTSIAGAKGKGIVPNVTVIQNTITKLTDKGFRLLTSNGGNGNQAFVSTYVFVKE